VIEKPFGARIAHRRSIGTTPSTPGRATAPTRFLSPPNTSVECKVQHPFEALDPVARQLDPLLSRNRWLQVELFAEAFTRAQCRSRSGVTPSKARAPIKHHRAKPRCVRARAHDSDVALMPIPLEVCPRL